MVQDMTKALKQAALLRNNLEGCLKAAEAPMTGRELADWPSVQEVIGTSLSGYSKLSAQLQQMVRKGWIEKLGKGQSTTYRWVTHRMPPAEQAATPVDLHLRVNRAARTVAFSFLGLNITIEVAQ